MSSISFEAGRMIRIAIPARHVLLIPNVPVYCDEDVKVPFSQRQQRPILLAAESRVSNSLTFMTAVGKQEFDLPGDTLIEEQFHFKVAVKLVLASSIAAIASALVTLGKSSRNSDSVRPCSRQSVSDLKGTRVPRKTGSPLRIAGLLTMMLEAIL